MNVSIELDNTLGIFANYLQRSQIYTSIIALIFSILILAFLCKRNVYHDNFRIPVLIITVSLIVNNFLILMHSIENYQNRKNVEEKNKDVYNNYDGVIKGNFYICDKYSPIPLPLMIIYIIMLIILLIERTIAINLVEKYEKIKFYKTIYYLSIPFWIFIYTLVALDYYSSLMVKENLLSNFCRSKFVEDYFLDFLFPFIISLPPLIIITWMFIKNYYIAKIIITSRNNFLENYLSTRFQMIENVRSNALLAIFSLLLLIIVFFYTISIFLIRNPKPKTITFFMEMVNTLISILTIIFHISILKLTPTFIKKIIKHFINFMKLILLLFKLRRYNYINKVQKSFNI
uniref:G_PROTEIN_RECEP_F1_2 domain-containing protein n=1 Tax=Strongyloides stercoralis TaxID=6248 RepID=A0A0K0E6W2_STRER